MLPNKTDRVVALDDADIVEVKSLHDSHDFHDHAALAEIEQNIRRDLMTPAPPKAAVSETELDLDDALEVQLVPEARSTGPNRKQAYISERPERQERPISDERTPLLTPVPSFLQPKTRVYRFDPVDPFGTAEPPVGPLTLKTPTRGIKPAQILSQLPATVAQPAHAPSSASFRAAQIVDYDDDEEEELTELKRPSSSSMPVSTLPGHPSTRARTASHITPSPFARSYSTIQTRAVSSGDSLHPESIAPVAVSTGPSSAPPAPSSSGRGSSALSNTMRLRRPVEPVAMDEASLERQERRELRAIVSTPSTRLLRGAALMLMGGVAAAAITAFMLRNDVPVAATNIAPPPVMAPIAVPQDAVKIGATPPPQMETRPGSQPAQEVKFDDRDAVLVAAAPSAAPNAAAAQASNAAAAPNAAASPASAAAASPAAATGPATGAGHASRESKEPRKAKKSSQPLPANALLPDPDPPSYALPAGRGGAPRDPVSEAQLRASMK